MFGRRHRVAARVSLVAAATAGVSVIGLAQAATAGAVSQQTLVGAWSGPAAIGATGECGNAKGEYAFSPDGTYRYRSSSDTCDGLLIEGHYQLQADGGVLQTSMEECSDPGCPEVPLVGSMSISAVNPDTIVLDGRYTFLRERA
jgi:hypothetical protein